MVWKLLLPISAIILLCAHSMEAKALNVVFSCSASNDLYKVVASSGYECARFDGVAEAIAQAKTGSAVLVLADGYPDVQTRVDESVYKSAAEKGIRLYVEYPSMVPDVELGKVQTTEWERGVVANDLLGDKLPKLHILAISGCRYLPAKAADALLVIARVAGFDKAVFGIPETASPILFRLPKGDVMVATTKLSSFVSGRYAPARDWGVFWEQILGMLDPTTKVALKFEPTVRPMYGEEERLPADAEKRAVANAVGWYLNGRMLVNDKEQPEVEKELLAGAEVRPVPPSQHVAGDGLNGILEGYAAGIEFDGSQKQRLPLRDDCNAEVAMALAVDASLNGSARSREVAGNLLKYIYENSGMCGGVRANPKHPAFGLMAWGAIAPNWTKANYGDDNARAILGTIIAEACLGTDNWNEFIARALLANLRTTGKLGFRYDRVDVGPLETNGWKHYADQENINYSPHMDSYLWACNLWAYRQTGYKPFLESTKTAIKMTVEAFPESWRWNDSNERSRMLLCLSWLVRLEDTPEHRGWLKKISDDLISRQQPSGAILELMGGTGGGHFFLPQSNEQYGVMETPLIQENGNPVSDQLYTTGFALLGLREAAAATGDAKLKAAEDKLAEYLCRIQVKSAELPYLNGTWFRAFDFGRWEYWASSADLGWGAWSAETGWGPAWITAILGLRLKGTTVWDLTKDTNIARHMDKVQEQMAENDGSPWKP